MARSRERVAPRLNPEGAGGIVEFDLDQSVLDAMVEPGRAEDEFAEPVDRVFAVALAEFDELLADRGAGHSQFAVDCCRYEIEPRRARDRTCRQLEFDCGSQYALLEVGTSKRVCAAQEGQRHVVTRVKVCTVHDRSVAKRWLLIRVRAP